MVSQLAPAPRTERFGFSDIVKIRNRVLELKDAGQQVIQLEGGEPFMPTPDFVKEAMKRALDANHTRYAASSGVPLLIDAIVEKLRDSNGMSVDPSQVIVCAGGMHALFCAFQVALGEGEETLFLSPYWTPIHDLVRYCGGTSVPVSWQKARADGIGATLRKAITPRTRVIYVNTPGNPTGLVLSREELEEIAALAREHDLVVIADEAYEDIVYGDHEHVSIASLPGMFERTLTCYTLSKSFSMTGWRVGYLVAAEMWMAPARKLVLNSVNGVSTPSQYAAAAAIGDRSDYKQRMLAEYALRRAILADGLRAAGFGCYEPEGAFYLFVDVRERLGNDSWKAMETLLSRCSVASVPGVVFGAEGEGHLRMSYSNPIETLESAVAAIARL